MTALRDNFVDILAPGQFKIFVDDMEQWPEEFSKIFNVSDSRRRYETGSSVTGFGTPSSKTEGGSITYEDPLQGYDETFQHVTYALGYRISQELFEDDLYNVIDQFPASLADSMMYGVEVVASGIFNNGFTDSADYLGPDGEPLFGDGSNLNHPLVGGGNEENQLATAADLNMDSLELLVQQMEETVDEKGKLGMLRASTLVVPAELKFIAKELLDPAAMKEKPHTGLRGINPMAGEDLNYFVWHFLTDPDAFFLLAKKHKLQMFWRVRPDFDMGDDFDTKDAKATSRDRFSVGWWDWRGVCGSPGA